MQQNSDLLNGTIQIFDKFDIGATQSGDYNFTPTFTSIGSEYILTFDNLEKVIKFDKFQYDTLGMTSTRFLNNFYRISRDKSNWTEWFPLNRNIDNFPTIDSNDPLYLDIKWVRAGTSDIGVIRLLDYMIEGDLDRVVVDDGSAVQLPPGKTIIMKAPYIYKVFSINDIEIISGSDVSNATIKYRYSQDNERTWSEWELFTKENITTTRINPIRFFQVEYSIHNNSGSNISIQDINIIGDVQNVSKDYFKSNLMGIRECCKSNKTGYTDANGNFVDSSGANTGSLGNTLGGNGVGGGNACATDGNGSSLPKMTNDEKAGLYNPYQQNTAMDLLNKLSTDAQQLFGHETIYFCTDPDKKGQDHTMHEYQLFNVVCEGNIKVSVDNNAFPDSQIVMNQFDLNLFEQMEVHITKQAFKEIFGPQRRPSKEDFLYFCNLNRMYQVDHAQQFRNFNNAAVYYKLHLKKYSQKANVKAGTADIADTLKNLTKNTTLDELMGIEMAQDKAAVANKDQYKPLSKDPIRLEYLAEIDKELIENSSTIISKSNYDMSSVAYGTPGVIYKNMDAQLRISDNIGYYVWFKLQNYIAGELYNLFHYYDDANSLGWKADLIDDDIVFTANNDVYRYHLKGNPTNDVIALDEDVWYCYVLNVDQRNREMTQWIYKRDIDDESEGGSAITTLLHNVYKGTQTIVPFEYIIEDGYCSILGSDMRITNVRLFIETIPESYHNKILNQYIIRDDSKHMVFADNATTRIYLPNFPYNE
jgi:hypothetical protein